MYTEDVNWISAMNTHELSIVVFTERKKFVFFQKFVLFGEINVKEWIKEK